MCSSSQSFLLDSLSDVTCRAYSDDHQTVSVIIMLVVFTLLVRDIFHCNQHEMDTTFVL